MKLSVGIRCYNDIAFLNEVLTQAEKIADEIFVIFDDRVNDGSLKLVQERAEKDKRYKYKLTKFDFTKTKNELRDSMTGDWLLFLDADEVLDDDCYKLKDVIKEVEKSGFDVISLTGHHFIYNLAFEDNTNELHVWRGRLFKNKPSIRFEGKNHEITIGFNKMCTSIVCKIWHMGYVKHLDKIVEKYHENIRYGLQIHTLGFLEWWKNSHLLGAYPVKQTDLTQLPSALKTKFLLEDIDDMKYFDKRRSLELKHYKECVEWKNFFNPKRVLFMGCGFGQRVKVMNDLGIKSIGWEKSGYAVRHAMHENIYVNDITKKIGVSDIMFDLVVAYDVLEHIEPDKISIVLDNIKNKCDKYLLVSVPVIGNPNLEADPTHLIKKDKAWWINQFVSRGFEQVVTPESFPFNDQVFVFKKQECEDGIVEVE